MKTRRKMQSLIELLDESRLLSLLFEEEGDEEEGDEEEDTDIFGDDEGDAEDGAEEDEDGAEDDTGGEEKEEEEEEEEEELPIETSVEDKIRLQDTLDDEINAVFGDFETRARKSAALSVESKWHSGLSVLLSEEKDDADQLDINQFAADVARLIDNYSTLLDMEAIIYIKAKQYLLDKYGEDTAKQLRDILSNRHGVDFMEDEPGLDDPIAVVGQGGGGGGGGL